VAKTEIFRDGGICPITGQKISSFNWFTNYPQQKVYQKKNAAARKDKRIKKDKDHGNEGSNKPAE
jgi:hypothetical protein